ncbi:hypothetical protein HSBAA_05130 [Vreelandella sulfidaeris]|uniref:Uncharacterized protein n=1 Tax=Vreelandella sulfidaeris TaxID=115553 RepID=A0A455U0X0_9GAMM|nr:hypothetical protein HSBAA_05130 [Halomonas sulfidaeris]
MTSSAMQALMAKVAVVSAVLVLVISVIFSAMYLAIFLVEAVAVVVGPMPRHAVPTYAIT